MRLYDIGLKPSFRVRHGTTKIRTRILERYEMSMVLYRSGKRFNDRSTGTARKNGSDGTIPSHLNRLLACVPCCYMVVFRYWHLDPRRLVLDPSFLHAGRPQIVRGWRHKPKTPKGMVSVSGAGEQIGHGRSTTWREPFVGDQITSCAFRYSVRAAETGACPSRRLDRDFVRTRDGA